MNDTIIHGLRRLADYGPAALGEPERELLRHAALAIHGTDDVLAEAVPHLNSLANLLEVVVDARKFTKAVDQLSSLVKEANAARQASAQAAADLDAKVAELEPKLAAAKKEHAAQLALEREAFDKRVADYQRSLSVREAAVADLEKAVKADADAAAELRSELQRRLDAIRLAAA